MPTNTDQIPVPTVGVFPAKLADVAQMVVFVPVFAIVGKSSLIMLTVEDDGEHTPLDMVHCNTFVPTATAVN